VDRCAAAPHDGAVPRAVAASSTGPAPVGSATVVVACDESGSEGEKLVGGSTDVFAHAGVLIGSDEASEVLRRVRAGTRSPAVEVKANVVLRPQNRRTLTWLLGDSGPLTGRASVFLVDKPLLLTVRLVGLWAAGTADAERAACDLHRVLTADADLAPVWAVALDETNGLLRARDLVTARARLERVRAALTAVLAGLSDASDRFSGEEGTTTVATTALAALVAGLPASDGGPETDTALGELTGPERSRAPLDPLEPGLVATVLRWAGPAGGGPRRPGGRSGPVELVHDAQSSLTDDRLARVRAAVGADVSSRVRMRFVDSQLDARVQVADLVAGAARRLAEAALHGRPDPGLLELVAAHVDPTSTWADERSWALLAPPDDRRGARATGAPVTGGAAQTALRRVTQ
jgi:hypothetical protein